jgi:hypothetical protein
MYYKTFANILVAIYLTDPAYDCFDYSFFDICYYCCCKFFLPFNQ